MKNVRVLDVEVAVGKSFKALPYPAYLAAMWIVTDELAQLYRDRNTPEGQELVDRSLRLLRMVVDGSAEAAMPDARQAAADWLALMGIPRDWDEEHEDDDHIQLIDLPVDPGVGGLWKVLRDLMHELVGDSPRYSSEMYLTGAITGVHDPFVLGEEGPIKVIVPSPFVDEHNPMVVLLGKCQTVAELMGGPDTGGMPDPDEVRAAVFRDDSA